MGDIVEYPLRDVEIAELRDGRIKVRNSRLKFTKFQILMFEPKVGLPHICSARLSREALCKAFVADFGHGALLGNRVQAANSIDGAFNRGILWMLTIDKRASLQGVEKTWS